MLIGWHLPNTDSEKFSHGANFRAFRAHADFAKIRTEKF